jgi:hypothetical protein
MLTWFQISTQRESVPGVPVGDESPVQTKISVSGPHGPVGPFDHQLSSPSRSTGRPSSCQSRSEPVSGPTWSSPPNTVTYSWSGVSPNPSVSSSYPQRTLCSWL